MRVEIKAEGGLFNRDEWDEWDKREEKTSL